MPISRRIQTPRNAQIHTNREVLTQIEREPWKYRPRKLRKHAASFHASIGIYLPFNFPNQIDNAMEVNNNRCTLSTLQVDKPIVIASCSYSNGRCLPALLADRNGGGGVE